VTTSAGIVPYVTLDTRLSGRTQRPCRQTPDAPRGAHQRHRGSTRRSSHIAGKCQRDQHRKPVKRFARWVDNATPGRGYVLPRRTSAASSALRRWCSSWMAGWGPRGHGLMIHVVSKGRRPAAAWRGRQAEGTFCRFSLSPWSSASATAPSGAQVVVLGDGHAMDEAASNRCSRRAVLRVPHGHEPGGDVEARPSA